MDRNPSNEHNRFYDGESAEYGIEHVMAKEEDIERARKRSKYRLSQQELEHKRDEVGKDEEPRGS